METLSNMTSKASQAIYGSGTRQANGSAEPASGITQNRDGSDPTQPYDGGNDETATRKMDISTDSQNDNSSSSNAGPHDSNIANKADPRADSDRDNRNNVDDNTNNVPKGDPGRYKNTAPGGGSGRIVEPLVDAEAGPPRNANNPSSNTETRLSDNKDTDTGPSAWKAEGSATQGHNVTGDSSVLRPGDISPCDEASATNRDGTGTGGFATGGYEPSVGAQPISGDRLTQTSGGSSSRSPAAGGGMPGATAGGSSDGTKPQSESHSEGTGEMWVKTSGMAADGGNFDATKPGAGKEADRLLEQRGTQRSGPPGSGSSGPLSDAAAPATGKKGLGEKVKEKLHLHKH